MVISNPKQLEHRFPIEQLLLPSAFPHSVKPIRVVETHISWVILTGEFAYKIKKPVRFDFVDYSTLDKRKHYCLKEVELNRRYASDLYLDVVPIFNVGGNYEVGDSSLEFDAFDGVESEPVEYAVKMKEFGQAALLSNQLNLAEFHLPMMPRLADRLARFHQSEPGLQIDDLDEEIEQLHKEVADNFKLLDRALANTPQAEQLKRIEGWTETSFQVLERRIRERIGAGNLKRCHGDLHLNNIILYQGELIPFDGIEFNRHLQEIDPLNEVAFPFMDLSAHQFFAHAWRFLSAYLEAAGGYADLPLFRFYTVYRAMVRAKVAWIHCQVQSSTTGHQSSWLKGDIPTESQKEPAHPWDHYLDFAAEMISEPETELTITYGFSGSGKSTAALNWIDSRGGIRLRSDAKRIQKKPSLGPDDLYSQEVTDEIYSQMLTDADACLRSGFSAVVDATFLSAKHRKWFRELAISRNIPFRILACDASFTELCSRIRNRHNDPSEATVDVLKSQMERFDPLTEQEKQMAVEAP